MTNSRVTPIFSRENHNRINRPAYKKADPSTKDRSRRHHEPHAEISTNGNAGD
jgi:hypothetical protein